MFPSLNTVVAWKPTGNGKDPGGGGKEETAQHHGTIARQGKTHILIINNTYK